jgi:hypothetical protein
VSAKGRSKPRQTRSRFPHLCLTSWSPLIRRQAAQLTRWHTATGKIRVRSTSVTPGCSLIWKTATRIASKSWCVTAITPSRPTRKKIRNATQAVVAHRDTTWRGPTSQRAWSFRWHPAASALALASFAQADSRYRPQDDHRGFQVSWQAAPPQPLNSNRPTSQPDWRVWAASGLPSRTNAKLPKSSGRLYTMIR